MERTAVELTSENYNLGSGYGDGDGYGYGYGDGDGYGSGYGDGYGSGYGDGDGYGSGYGDGDGYGSGSGDGSGSGSGSGSGDGDGDGDGYGYGYGYGDGYGDGDGSGYGDGDGDEKKKYFTALLGKYRRPNLVVVFWRSNMDGTPSNGGSGIKVAVGDTHTADGPLKICTKNGLHGTNDPTKWKGARWWIVGLHHPIQSEDDKSASLTRTIIADLGKCPFE